MENKNSTNSTNTINIMSSSTSNQKDNSLISYGAICYKNFSNDINKKDYRIVLVRRKNTIGYVEFLRGKYELNNETYLLILFNYMTNNEKKNILKIRDFDKLRNLLGMTKKNNIYKTEYEKAQIKFNFLKNNVSNNMNLEYLINKSENKWNETEWGLPKGRKHQKEMDLNCAIREFIEETNICKNDFKILFNVKPIIEEYVSINGIKYKHIYYLANFINKNDKLMIDPKNKIQMSEINGIKWVTREEAPSLIRDYYIEKKKIIEKAFNILNELSEYELLC